MTPTLSLCIATYNRARFIGETLESVIPQLTEETELLVVDGASTDDTAEVVERYRKGCPPLRYVRLAEKGGVDHDYDLTVQLAAGEYCWLFTDDDILKPGAVAEVLKRLKEGHDLVVVNGEVRNLDLSELLEESRLPLDADRTYREGEFERFFTDCVSYMSFIGCVVLRRSVWMERERERYYGLEFIHLGVIFQKPLTGTVLALARPYIELRLGNAQWSARAFEIWVFKWPGLLWSFEPISAAAKGAVTHREPWRRPARLAFLRAEGNFGPAEYARFIRPRLSSRRERLMVAAIAHLPGALLNLVATLYHRYRSPQNRMLHVSLRHSKHNYMNLLHTLCPSWKRRESHAPDPS